MGPRGGGLPMNTLRVRVHRADYELGAEALPRLAVVSRAIARSRA
jgi:hypothetical protein